MTFEELTHNRELLAKITEVYRLHQTTQHADPYTEQWKSNGSLGCIVRAPEVELLPCGCGWEQKNTLPDDWWQHVDPENKHSCHAGSFTYPEEGLVTECTVYLVFFQHGGIMCFSCHQHLGTWML